MATADGGATGFRQLADQPVRLQRIAEPGLGPALSYGTEHAHADCPGNQPMAKMSTLSDIRMPPSDHRAITQPSSSRNVSSFSCFLVSLIVEVLHQARRHVSLCETGCLVCRDLARVQSPLVLCEVGDPGKSGCGKEEPQEKVASNETDRESVHSGLNADGGRCVPLRAHTLNLSLWPAPGLDDTRLS
jgi:hypothetical protein